ncbi:ABC transporter permease [Nocardia yunnanensis]|uniref:ABC transporter permease n=1 Tax=Nocardia yunnanensis TaxID=2382165 RepID=A0A386Z4T2_9NOCA|nr:ABC transporter permease [Nocardia yunnanensis]AYF72661.1 ABC transporter permease [Nocardia yunnanensis]
MAGNPMRKVALRNLAAHKVRLFLTVLSVVLGTAFVAGTYMFTDTLQRAFDDIFASQAKGVDVRVQPKEGLSLDNPYQQSVGIPYGDVDKIAAIDGVRAVAPASFGPVVLLKPDGKAVQVGGAPTQGTSYLPPDKAVGDPLTFLAGTPPDKPGDIAINQSGATRAGLHVGDHTKVLIPSKGTVDVTVTGIYDLSSNTGGYINLLFDAGQARELFTDGKHYAYVDVAAKPGVTANALRDSIAKAFPDDKVQNGDQVRADLKAQLADRLKFLNYFLLAFGAIAVLVGTFIIYNTFSMLVTQRLRELALLRAVGASRRQVGWSVVSEAALIGLLGSVIGLVLGIGLAFGISAALKAFDVGLPAGTMQVQPRTVVIAIAIGVLVTMASAWAPARRAATTPPVEAMREASAPSTGARRLGAPAQWLVSTLQRVKLAAVAGWARAVLSSRWLRPGIGVVLGAAGVVVAVIGAQGSGGDAARTVGIGALALILAVLLVSPALSRPVLTVLGVLVRPFGTTGKMARSNAIRNPNRTAATAFALTLGVLLVSAIAMLGASAKASIGDLVDKGVKADYMLAGPPGGIISVPLGATAAAQQVPQVQDVVAFHGIALKVDGKQVIGTVPEGPMNKVIDYTVQQGTDKLGDDDVMVSETFAADHHWKVGDSVNVDTIDFKKYKVNVVGVYKDTTLLGALVAPMNLYGKAVPPNYQSSFLVAVTAQPGANLPAMRTALEKAVDPFAIVQVEDRNDFKGAQGKQIDTLLAVLYALLALAVIIAILGIVNTLALSVVERRREIGMLRAVGMQRPQVRRSIYLESMLIAIFGAVVGVVLGIGLGIGFLKTLAEYGIATIAVPWTQIVLMLFASGVVGILAALWPAVRAARTPPLAAIADL